MADEAGYLRLVMSPSRGPPAPLVVDSCPQNPGDLPIGVSANSRAISPFLLSTWPPLLGSTRLHCRTDAAQTTKVSCVSRSADEAGQEIARSLEDDWQKDLLFVLKQEQDGYQFCQKQNAECDRRLSFVYGMKFVDRRTEFYNAQHRKLHINHLTEPPNIGARAGKTGANPINPIGCSTSS